MWRRRSRKYRWLLLGVLKKQPYGSINIFYGQIDFVVMVVVRIKFMMYFDLGYWNSI